MDTVVGLGLTDAGALGTEAAKDDGEDVTVHGLAHDVGEDGTRRSDQGADHGKQWVVEHEALSAESPARVRVQDRDHHGHVRATNGRCHVGSKGARHDSRRGQGRRPNAGACRGQEGSAGNTRDGSHARVQGVPHAELQRRRVEVAVELAKGHNRARCRHSTDEGGEVDGRRPDSIHGVVGWVCQVSSVVADRCADSSQSDQGVESGHSLGQFCGSHPRAQGVAHSASGRQESADLGGDSRSHGHGAKSRGEAQRHAGHAEDVAHAGGLLGGEAGDTANAAEARGHGDGLGHEPTGAHGVPDGVAANHGADRDGVEAVVLWRVRGALEHVEHLLRHEEATSNIHGGDEHSRGAEELARRRGHDTTAHEHESTHGGHAGDGVGDGHEG
mmetsp:Transcript_14691/g.43515  ORF Transcript_14691/g.43515 Transcript_14691/m.43515 type:complete len:387 (+) Transcript_14691:826-1986(+)